MKNKLSELKIRELLDRFPWVEDFFSAHSIDHSAWLENSFAELCSSLSDEFYADTGSSPAGFSEDFFLFIQEMSALGDNGANRIRSITILPGYDKAGEPETGEVILRQGMVTAIVGPTGSGKSRLLEDIECLAQADTPTKRKILVDERVPSYETRFSNDGRLIAQLSQNMNFVMDLSVQDFLMMHAESRMVENIGLLVENIFKKANELAGEPFSKTTPITQLSGGQSRALMIADTALLSQAPIILIDEIENAGVDKKKALELLVDNNKIVLIATHDPFLALSADQRIIIRNGGIEKTISTTSEEKSRLVELKKLDDTLMQLRTRLRRGELICGWD
ncbi:ATP-binding cassette domain-containing protein [Maridesulfovibrio sp.]|uniref:ATP-binding cassette domain-containing protein n=1 Tax=Maridesulfovibrio sp. TaxID=2795000 RepID=UPI002A18DDF0|nr:ATP-binding cassette domain-containing protein [Maridesulfovibrio sp.]